MSIGRMRSTGTKKNVFFINIYIQFGNKIDLEKKEGRKKMERK